MKTLQLMASSISESPTIYRKVTRRMLRERAFELALISGRSPQDASAPEWEQAGRDLINPSSEGPEIGDFAEINRLGLGTHLNADSSGCAHQL